MFYATKMRMIIKIVRMGLLDFSDSLKQ